VSLAKNLSSGTTNKVPQRRQQLCAYSSSGVPLRAARGIRGQWQPYSQSREADFPPRETHVPSRYFIPALEDLVRRPEPLNETEGVKLFGEMVARIGISRERYVHELSTMFASETWLK
jgi:hypothetical protein